MRFKGTLTSWDDARGFGFIEADQGGQPVFVHIKAFSGRSRRPQVDDRLTFEVELAAGGKKRAKAVRPHETSPRRRTRPPRDHAPPRRSGLFATPVFALVYLVVALLWRVPTAVAGVYAAASLICFAAYAVDKSAAMAGRWRISERHLLLLGLIGGWPGALLAQQTLRHKSSKASFRSAFWATVVFNVAAFVVLYSPFLASLS